MASSAEVSSITPSPPHQMYFTSALDVALPSSPCTPEEGENQVNYTDVLGQRDHPLVHALDALAGLQGLALGAVGLPEVLQVGCFGGRGLQRGWRRHKEQSWSQVPPVSPSSMAEHHPGTAPGHQAHRASLRLTLPVPALTLLLLPRVVLPVPLVRILQQLGPFLVGQAG